MATFLRGYSFGTTEIVNAAKLHRLVENAQLLNLNLSDFVGTVQPISIFSGPTNPVTGSTYFGYEVPTLEISSYSGVFSHQRHFIYNEKFNGYVALICAYGMETRRWVGGNDITAFLPGQIAYHESTGTVTLTLGDQGGGGAAAAQGIFGSVGPETIPGGGAVAGRVRFGGWAEARTTGQGQGTDAWPWMGYLFGVGQSTQAWTLTGSSSLDGGWFIRLYNLSTGGPARLPVWLTAGPNFR